MWLNRSFVEMVRFLIYLKKSTYPVTTFVVVEEIVPPPYLPLRIWLTRRDVLNRRLEASGYRVLRPWVWFVRWTSLSKDSADVFIMFALCDITQMCLLAVDLATVRKWENWTAFRVRWSSRQVWQFCIYKRGNVFKKKHFTLVNNRRDVERLLWCTVLWEWLFPIYDIWRKRLCSPSVEHVYKPSFLLWSQCICVTMRAEVKGLHMIISLGAVASRLTYLYSTAQWGYRSESTL